MRPRSPAPLFWALLGLLWLISGLLLVSRAHAARIGPVQQAQARATATPTATLSPTPTETATPQPKQVHGFDGAEDDWHWIGPTAQASPGRLVTYRDATGQLLDYSTCVSTNTWLCATGANAGAACTVDSQCPTSTCTAFGSVDCPANPTTGGCVTLKEGADDGTNTLKLCLPDAGLNANLTYRLPVTQGSATPAAGYWYCTAEGVCSFQTPAPGWTPVPQPTCSAGYAAKGVVGTDLAAAGCAVMPTPDGYGPTPPFTDAQVTNALTLTGAGGVHSFAEPALVFSGPAADPSPSPSVGSWWWRADLPGPIGTPPTPGPTPLGRFVYRDSQGRRSVATTDDKLDAYLNGAAVANGADINGLNMSADFAFSCDATSKICTLTPGAGFFMDGEELVSTQLPATLAPDNTYRYWGNDQDFSLRYNTTKYCTGGTNAGGTCSVASACPGGTCEEHMEFAGRALAFEQNVRFTTGLGAEHMGTAYKTGSYQWTFYDPVNVLPTLSSVNTVVVNKTKAVTLTQICCYSDVTGSNVALKEGTSTSPTPVQTALPCATPGWTGDGGCTSTLTSTAFGVNEQMQHNSTTGANGHRISVVVKYTIDED